MKISGNVLIGSIVSYSEISGKYYVRYPGMGGDETTGFSAQLLSPTPFGDGGGLKSVPAIPMGTPCLLFNTGTKWYIIGFISPSGPVIHDSHLPVRPINNGEIFTYHNTGSRFGFNAIGSFVSWASDMANVTLNPIAQKMSAYFKNMIINLYSGFIEYKYNMKKNAGLLTLQISKELDLSVTDPSKVIKDKFVISIGQQENNEHLLEFKAQQDYQESKLPKFEAVGKLGKQSDGTFLVLNTKEGLPGDQVEYNLESDITGKTKFKIQKKDSSSSIDGTLDPGSAMVVDIRINKDKAELLIDKEGNVTIKTTPNAKIMLGGTGSENQLLTKAYHDQYIKNHIHSNGNNGAPTGPPISPQALTTSQDSPTNHWTFTTKAE